MQAWRRLSGDPVLLPIRVEVERMIVREQALGNKLKICVGTDSEVRGPKVEFATVIVLLREKKGGVMLINSYAMKQKMGIKERMLLEVSRSIDISYKLCDLLDKYNVELEVHADINTDPQFKSNVALSEAMGYILSMGFAFKAKPYAFASTSCADKMI